MRDEGRRLRDEIAALTGQAATTDAAEDAVQGPDVRGDERCRRSCSDARIDSRRLRRRRRRLEARQAEEDRGQGPHTPDDDRKGRGTKPFARAISACRPMTPRIISPTRRVGS